MTITITEEHPLTPDLALLFDRHTADMHADAPPESIHMMDKGALATPGIRFFVMRDSGQPVAMGRLQAHRCNPCRDQVDARPDRGARARPVKGDAGSSGRRGRQRRLFRLSLETGVQPTFVAARALYARAGFLDCGPFKGYGPDPNSVFMTKALG